MGRSGGDSRGGRRIVEAHPAPGTMATANRRAGPGTEIDRARPHLGLLPSAQVAIIESALEVIGEGDAATRARLLALAFVGTMEAHFADAEELMHKAADAAVAMGAADCFAVFAGQAAALATIAGHHSELPANVVQVIEAGPVQPTSALAHAIIRIVSVTAWPGKQQRHNCESRE